MKWGVRRWLLVCSAIGAVGSAACVLLLTRDFQAEATLEFRATSVGLSESSWHELLTTESVILRSRSVCERAASRVIAASATRTSLEGIKQQTCEGIDVDRVPKARILRIKTAQADRGVALSVVEAVAQAYLDRRQEQDPAAQRSVQVRISELEGKSDELAQLEHEAHAFAREHDLLTYDPEVAMSELGLVKAELVRLRIHIVQQQAELKQLEQAVQARSYAAPRLAGDPEFRAERARAARLEPAAVLAPAGDAGAAEAPREASPGRVHELALATVATARAELALLEDEQRKLTELLASEENQIAARGDDLIELRKRQRVLEERQAIRETVLRWNPETAARQAAPLFAVGVLDHARIVGRYPSTAAWIRAALLLLAGLAGAALSLRLRQPAAS